MKNNRGPVRGRACGVLALLLVAFLGGEGCALGGRPEGIYAEIQTSRGLITALLEHERVPLTVTNFVGLAEGTIQNDALPLGVPFFDGSTFHRVVPGHVIQGGVPAATEQRTPGYTFVNEIHPELSHGHGLGSWCLPG